jgi:hypothetical protein
MMRVNDIQLERGDQLFHKRRNRYSRRDISWQRQWQAWIAENEWLLILVVGIKLGKDEYIVTLFHENFAEGGYGPHHSVHNWMIGIGEKSDVQVYSVGFCNKESSL